MSRGQIGLVCEGITDHIALKELLPAAINELRSGDFIDIQPNPDRTAVGADPDGGWTKVLKWCLSNPPILRRQLYIGGGLFEVEDNSCGIYAIIVQIDSDICERSDFQNKSHVDPSKFDLGDPSGRGEYVRRSLHEWLWPDGNVDDDLSWTIVSSAVESVESWLVAGLLPNKNPETIRNPAACLKIRNKTKNKYIKLARRAAPNVERIVERCKSFSTLVERCAEIVTA